VHINAGALRNPHLRRRIREHGAAATMLNEQMRRHGESVRDLDEVRGRLQRARSALAGELSRLGTWPDGKPSAQRVELEHEIRSLDERLALLDAERLEIVGELESQQAAWQSIARLLTRLGEHHGVRGASVDSVVELLIAHPASEPRTRGPQDAERPIVAVITTGGTP
jgi:chromosome segregation ATPase